MNVDLFECDISTWPDDTLYDDPPEGHIHFYVLSMGVLDYTKEVNRISLGITARRDGVRRLEGINAKNHAPLKLLYYGNGTDKAVRKWEQFVKALFEYRLVDGAGKETFDLYHADIQALNHTIDAMRQVYWV